MTVTVLVTRSYLTLRDPMDCSPSGSSVHGVFQARILEWVAISSRVSFRRREWTHIPCVFGIPGRFFTHWAIRECLTLCDPHGLYSPWNSLGQNTRASLVAQSVKNLPAVQEAQVWSLGWDDPLEKEMANHSSILARKIPWTEDPGGLQSMGSQRVRHDWGLTRSHWWSSG